MTDEQKIIRILLIEDDREHARIMCRALEGHAERMSVTVAGTLREARALLAETTPHLVVADLRLPDGDGLELLPTNEDSARFPMVVITAHGDEQAAVAALKAGALDYVVKSTLNLSDLPRVASRAVREWRHIVERKWAEEKLNTISLAAEQMTEGMAVVDLEGNILFINAAFASMHGYTPKEVLGKHLSVFHSPKQMPVVEAANQELKERGEFHSEIPHMHRDGTPFATMMNGSLLRDESGKPIGMIGSLRNITEQKRAEEALRASEARYRAVVETQTELICRYPPDGTLTFVNDAYCRYFGKTRESILGRKFMPFIPESDREGIRAYFASLGPENPVATHEHRVIAAGGEIRWQQWTNKVIFDEEGNVVELQGVGRDVTKRKQAEAALRKAHNELERRVEERTAELAEERRLLKEMLELQERERKLISYEIHDGLAQQLVGAQMRLQALSQPCSQASEEVQKTFAGGLQLLAEAMNETRRLISGLRPPILDESGVVAAIDYLVQEMTEREELEIEFHHDVQFDRLAAPLEAAIFRIVQESLNNACHHSQSEKVRVELTGKNGIVRIEVRDWGIGFDPDKVDRNRYGLQGLRERARLFKGQATIDSAPGKGTRIVAELPVLERPLVENPNGFD